ncbi:Lon protease family protein [Pseudothermotoga thermarum]|uniref:Lon protease family protein n=1 Tax=Pseudothermotoga thermarum TaxID=119394 RepID=UPI003899259F
MFALKATYDDLVYNSPYLPEFKTIGEIKPFEGFIGQERAIRAFETALNINERGFNVFVVGVPQTGRRTLVTNFLMQRAIKMNKPKDWIYVYNFSNPSEPKAISLEPGKGVQFKRDMEKLAEDVIEAIEKMFESEDYAAKKAELEDEYMARKTRLWEELREKAAQLGFAVQLTPTGVITVPVYEGKPVTPEVLETLPEEVKNAFNENSRKLKHIIEGTLYKSRKLDREYKEKLIELDKYAALFTVGSMFEEMIKQYEENEGVVEYLKEVEKDILDNLVQLKTEQQEFKEVLKKRYSVNLFVDNSQTFGAPVIFERNPTYANLVGKVEYYSRSGMLFTDFTLIKPGALHKANGGFLILEAENVLRNPFAWEGLKRCLLSGEIVVENLETALGFSNIVSLRPQSIPLDVKVFLIATPRIYYLLYEYDEDVRKLFKIKGEFDWEMDANAENVQKYLGFISSVCCRYNLPELDREAVRRVLWYSARLAADKRKFSMRFGEISSLIREACSIASQRGSKIVEEQDVKEAFERSEERVNLLQTKYDEHILQRYLMIETTGEKVGQVNGLTVLDLGDYSFGIPVKITAKVHLGQPGVVDLQREADLSGRIHSKAVLTIASFFGQRYVQKFPLTLSATLNFEQVYSIVEGDSASLAEVVALISAIANVPVKQGIAVTGSMNQNGEAQPVGGVTEKVEGFHRACKLQGLTGEQGVIIPKANLENLVLKDEVLEDIKKGLFHIWTVEHVDEVIEILTGRKPGKQIGVGKFEKGTVNDLVVKALEKAYKMAEKIEAGKKAKRKGKNRRKKRG